MGEIPTQSKVLIDGSKSKFIHYDVLEIVKDFLVRAKNEGIEVEIKGKKLNKKLKTI